ncbi:ribosome biogenesis protein SLX9 homolog [Babylonia areolata]|uniref:ribosome biogenesis protein SLX9 homolog n=1 Tax=Babylonia areolata TaxID=304850 RepID=UPI003FCFDC43
MGKEKRGRKKLHTPAPKAAAKNDVTLTAQDDKMSVASMKKPGSVAPSKAMTNPFKGMKITTETLKQVLPEFDAQSAITSKTFQGMNLKKKDKKKIRHDLWMEKIETVQKERKERRAKKKREQTVVVGDMQGIADALPTLELLQKQTPASVLAREKSAKKKGISREKTRQKEMLSNIQLFQQVLEVPEYKANPAETILEHLRNKLKQEQAMDT